MNPPLTLSTAPYDSPAMDYEFLRQEGLRHLERLSGQLWTDFNAHDPGITILEQVCYAITDLAHRIHYDLPDLLAKAGEPTYDSLYRPAQILPSEPVTIDDLRKLIIDVEGVKNAWVETDGAQEFPLYFHQDGENKILSLQGDPLTDESIQLKGLYRVLVEISDLVNLDGKTDRETQIMKSVRQRLYAHRPLCEDFTSVDPLQPQGIRVRAHIEIDPVEDAERLMVAIYQAMAECISPSIRFHSLRELLDAGKRVDEIFDDPLLEHGFIDTQELRQAQRRTVLHTSDLISAIMGVPGVRAVRTIAISKGGDGYEPWSLTLDSQGTGTYAPKLDPANSSIVLERNQLPTQLDGIRVLALYEQQLRSLSAGSAASDDNPLELPPGRDRQMGSYYSFQHQFPPVYGIGAAGLPDSATPRRRAQAKQLKAYLLFFDQLLANYFAQLAHVRDLFSFSTGSTQTYFSQVIDDPDLGLDELYQLSADAYAGRLQMLTEYLSATPAPGEQSPVRRNRFLNHLLARFAEQFTDYSLVLYGALTASAADPVKAKQDFLRDYPQISSARGTGYNTLLPRSDQNRSGLEKRIERKLALTGQDAGFFIVEHILLRPMAGDEAQDVPLLENAQFDDPYSLQLTFVFSDALLTSQDKTGFQAFVERTVREETPAHLIPIIRWLDDATLQAVSAAYQDWIDKRYAYWKES